MFVCFASQASGVSRQYKCRMQTLWSVAPNASRASCTRKLFPNNSLIYGIVAAMFSLRLTRSPRPSPLPAEKRIDTSFVFVCGILCFYSLLQLCTNAPREKKNEASRALGSSCVLPHRRTVQKTTTTYILFLLAISFAIDCDGSKTYRYWQMKPTK